MLIACVIPARGASKRIPRKNLKLLAGRPLLHWSIEAAQRSKAFDAGVWVSSEDEEILASAVDAGAYIVRRPPELAQDHVSAHAPVTHAATVIQRDFFEIEAVCLQQPTSPFVTPETFRAMASLMAATEWPGVCGAVEVPHKQHMISYDCWGLTPEDDPPLMMKSIFAEHSDPRIHLPTEPKLVARACPYFMRVACALRDLPVTSIRDLAGHRLSLIEGWDIDTLEEWEIAETMAAQRAYASHS